MVGVERGIVALYSLLIIEKGSSPFNFQSNKPFLKFLRQQMAISKFISDGYRDSSMRVCVCGGVYPPFDRSES